MAMVGGLGRERKAFLVGLCQEKTRTRLAGRDEIYE